MSKIKDFRFFVYFSAESGWHLSYISVENGDFSLEKVISPDDGSLGDKLLISDITGDGNDEIIVSQVVGMGGGAGSVSATVYRIENGSLQEIFGKEECEKFSENGISIKTDGRKTVFENSETGLSVSADLNLPEDAYVGSFCGFEIDSSGSLIGKRAIISAEDTGYIFSVWKYDKDSLKLSSIYYSEKDERSAKLTSFFILPFFRKSLLREDTLPPRQEVSEQEPTLRRQG